MLVSHGDIEHRLFGCWIAHLPSQGQRFRRKRAPSRRVEIILGHTASHAHSRHFNARTAPSIISSMAVLKSGRSPCRRRKERIVKRANDGRKAAKEAGARFGRPRKLNDTQQIRAREMLRLGGKLREVALEMNVHHSTIS